MTKPFQKLASFFARLRRDSFGNALMLTGLMLPVLIGAVGYSVDTAQWYAWKRELQHSVDQAAIGGAYALSYSSTADYETRAKQEFAANNKLITSFVTAPSVSLTGFSGGTNNSVYVTASAEKKLPFSGMLFGTAAKIKASAQATFAAGGTYSACLVALSKTGTGFSVGGSATVIAKCGLGALSCDANAIVIDGAAKVTTDSIVACGTVSAPSSLSSKITEGATSLSDEYADWTVPKPNANTVTRTYACAGKGNNKIATPQPGTYVGGITASCNTTFSPGVYFIDGGTLDLTYNGSVVANNVLFILKNRATIKLGGQGNGSLQMSPMTETQLASTAYSADKAKLSQMVVMQDTTNQTDFVDVRINGNANVNLSGIIYMPKGNATITGNSSSANNLCFQMSTYTLTVSGSAYLSTLCDKDDTTTLGSSKSLVKLVL